MSFSRIKYDKNAFDLQMNRSIEPGNYRMAPEFAENCNQCFSATGPIGNKADVSLSKENFDLTFGNLAETESQLSWRNQPLSKSNENKQPFGLSKLVHKPVCSNKLTSEDTRFTFPIDNYRSMSLTSYMVSPYLPINPQCNIIDNCNLIGLNSRLSAKDTYKQPKIEMWDMGEALPTPN